MYQKYVILRQELPSELSADQVRHIIAHYYKIDPNAVLMNEKVPDHKVCLLRLPVKDEKGKVIGVQG